MVLYHLKNVKKQYGNVTAFKANDVKIEKNKLIAIVGNSGSGKTSLLKMLGTITKPTSGEIIYNDIDISKLKKKKQDRYFRNEVDVVFQEYNLIENLTVKENLTLLSKLDKSITEQRITSVCKDLGIDDLLMQQVIEISGGEKQRVAVARSLLKPTKVILADEPTGALDIENTEKVMSIFRAYASDEKTILYVTHDLKCASLADKIYIISDGVIVKSVKGTNPVAMEKYLQQYFMGGNDE